MLILVVPTNFVLDGVALAAPQENLTSFSVVLVLAAFLGLGELSSILLV